MKKSLVCQMPINSTSQALAAFDKRDKAGAIPVVLCPRDFGRPFQFMVNIPSGVYILYQKWHKHAGMATPGLIWFWSGYHRVSHIVTKSTVTYNSPVRSVPTSDNVMVDIDLSLTFQIGPDEDAAYRFVYHLGAHRFDDLLTAQCDEAIRGLVYSVPYRKVHDLREAFAVGTMRALNAILLDFGVMIKSVKVTDVRLPKELALTLENTTSFKTKMLEQEKKHENDMRNLNYTEKQNLTAIQKANERRQQEQRALLDRLLISREEDRSNTTANVDVAKTDAEAEASVKIAQAKSNKGVAEAKGRKKMIALVEEIKMNSAAQIINAEMNAKARVIASEASLAAAKAKAAIISEQAQVEGLHASDYSELRQYEYELKRFDVLKSLAAKGKFIVNGNNDLFKQILPGTSCDMMMCDVSGKPMKTRLSSIDATRP